MATAVKMPKIGLADESSIISRWHKKKGDAVKAEDILFTIETDKSTFDVEAETEGIILEVFFDEGDEVPVLSDVGVIGNPDEDISGFIANREISEEIEKSEKTEAIKRNNIKEKKICKPEKSDTEKFKISPRAKRLAEKKGIDVRSAVATGPEGRIIEEDIIKLIKQGPILTFAAKDQLDKTKFELADLTGTGIGERITTKDLVDYSKGLEREQHQGFTEIKLSKIRKIIAENMSESLANTAQLTLNSSFDATAILTYRGKIKRHFDQAGLQNISLNDMISFAVSRTLLSFKTLNAHLVDDKMLIYDNVNLGVAVDTERGLMVPTVFCANLMSLNQISKTTKDLVEQCKKGNINPDILTGGTFTITNLGSLGVETFTPILNPPQVAILGVGTLTQRAKEVNDEFIYYPAMRLSLTLDHRAIDGAPAARFLKQLAANLENFNLLLAK